MPSNMFCLKLNLLQCLMCFLLLWPAIVYSFPSTELSHRYQRDASETVFPQGGGLFELVIQGEEQEVFEFQVCCNKDDGCSGKSFTFCFPSSSPTPTASAYARDVQCNKPKTCAYQINFNGFTTDNKRSAKLFLTIFTPTSECFKGKITSTEMHALNTKTEFVKVDGCPLDFDTKKRLIINILNTIPDGVTVKALNAKEYVEPTTLPPSTAPPTEEPDETDGTTKKEFSAAGATTPETGMSDALKFSLMGVGIFVFLLIVGGIGFAIYWFCFKKKKSSKPAPPVIVPKTAADESPAAKEAAPIVNDKTFEPKPKTTTENETQDIEPSKQAASNVPSKNAAPRTFSPSNLVSPSAAAAEIPPPPTMVSKDYTASKEPNNNSEFSKTDASKLNKTDDQTQFDNDESLRDGKSMSKKSRKQTSFSKEVATALDKKKIKKTKAIK